jgi:tight adherence protein C
MQGGTDMDIGSLFTLTNLIILAAVALAVFGAASFFAPEDNLRRLRPEAQTPGGRGAAAPAAAAPTSLQRGGSAWQRLITRPFQREAPKPTAGAVSGRNPVELWLIQAGYDSPLAAQTYYASRVGLGILLPVLSLAMTPIIFGDIGTFGFIFAGCLPVLVGALAPVKYVNGKLKKRQLQITDGLPEVLDLMLVCTEAGLGIDTAIDRVGEECARSQPVLSSEMRVISLQLRAGRPRADAMHAFAERTGVEEVRSLVNLLVQADAFGTSIAQTLKVFAEDMRTRRLLKAEEAANTVTVKLSIVLVACFLPALLTAIMAPIIFHAIAVFPHFG